MGIALFGGSFDPYHKGHDAIKTHLLSLPYIHTILLIPANISPNKTPSKTTIKDRLAMLRFAVTDPKILINDFEISRGGISYSIETVEHFKKRYSTEEIYYVIGADSFFDLHTWKESKRLVSITKFLVYARDTSKKETFKAYLDKHFSPTLHSHFLFPKISPVSISSSELRKQFIAGKRTSDYLSQPVLDYIDQHGLYPVPVKK